MAPATMIVTNTPAADLSLTYFSPIDLQTFAIPGTKLNPALIADSFSYIALNAIQRRNARVSSGDLLSVSRFTPPDDFNLTVLTLELELVKKGTKSEQGFPFCTFFWLSI
ncbi:putative vesicle-fusing ATPase [Rosa chinensis]|uniref:Putative vesicle-fusing ATPase n=1 Tax=Rosa chinensis TaxID=74649 RepID=A0A2P6QXU9_ROSCH|nr:putative vesicle-fusing ATPase [Rosa chinensis]